MKHYLDFLQLFADDAAADELEIEENSGEDAQAAAEEDDANNEDNTEGEDNDDEGAENNEPKSFDDLINGDYKDAFNSKVQEIVKNRIKENKDYQKKYESLTPALEAFAKRYNLDTSDPDKLADAIYNDDELYAQRALDEGISVEALKKMDKLERDSKELKRIREEQEAAHENEKQWKNLEEKSKSVKEKYPEFDLVKEITNNEDFARYVAAGIEPQQAYELTHLDDIKNGVLKTAQKKIAKSVASNSKRPTENGVKSNNGASQTKIDVDKLTDAEIKEYLRRARENGERISF